MSNPIVTIEMENGKKIVAELYPDIAPQSVRNFISLANAGFYNGLIFHRCIYGFMIQGGCPDGTGMGGPGYCIKGEFEANGYIEGMNSAIGRIGFVLGQKVKNDSDIYIKADLLHEFAGERDLQLTSDAGGTNDILREHSDYGDTWFELGLGGNVRISKTGNFYGEVTRGFGGDINKKWSVNAGLRFTF